MSEETRRSPDGSAEHGGYDDDPEQLRHLENEFRALLDPPPTAPVRIEALAHNRKNAVTFGIWRVVAGATHAVAKVVTRGAGDDPEWQASSVPSAWNYYRREVEFYASDLAAAFAPMRIRPPRLIALEQRSPETTAIWLEDVAGTPGCEIDVARLRELAWQLGRAQATWTLARRELPSWASHRFLRDYTASKRIGWEQLHSDAAWQHPLVKRCFPPALREASRMLHRSREWLLEVMESLPRTLAHLDLWPNNLIFAATGETVLLDWAFVGDGALGEDIGNLVPDAVFDRFISASELPNFERAALEGYLEGAEQAGWRGDPRQIELGFYASAVKYDWLTPLMLARAGDAQIDYGGTAPVDASERYRERGETLLRLTHWAQRARRMVEATPSLVAPLATPQPHGPAPAAR